MYMTCLRDELRTEARSKIGNHKLNNLVQQVSEGILGAYRTVTKRPKFCLDTKSGLLFILQLLLLLIASLPKFNLPLSPHQL